MFRPLAVFVLLAAPGIAGAADRTVFVSSFDRLRVEGPFQVSVMTGGPPRAQLSGEPAALEAIEVRQDGTTVVVRRRIGRWQEQPQTAGAAPVAVTLSTPVLAGASVVGAGAVAVTTMKATRVDLSVAGTGSIAVTTADGAQVNATAIGNGQITLGGRASKARLLVNGAGFIHADALDAGEVTVRLDGPGEATARARYTADIANTGLGRVAIEGTPKCVVKAEAGGVVTCGAGPVK